MLQHLQETNCPDCGAQVVSEARRGPHTNGLWHEEKTFSCGHEILFSPVHSRIIQKSVCPKSESSKAERQKRGAAKLDILSFVAACDVDQAFKTRLAEAIHSVG